MTDANYVNSPPQQLPSSVNNDIISQHVSSTWSLARRPTRITGPAHVFVGIDHSEHPVGTGYTLSCPRSSTDYRKSLAASVSKLVRTWHLCLAWPVANEHSISSHHNRKHAGWQSNLSDSSGIKKKKRSTRPRQHVKWSVTETKSTPSRGFRKHI